MSDTRLESLAQHLAAFEEQSAVEHAQNRILIQQATRRAVLNDKVLLALRLDASSTAFQLAQAARRSGLAPDRMSVIERKQFAELTKSPTLKGYYLETRNAILSRWHLDHLRFLTPFEALKHIPPISEINGYEIWKFLCRFGYINHGFLDRPTSPCGGPQLSLRHSDKASKTVVVVGAGMSGLAAAQQLREAFGYTVIVLEARGRVGGRASTDCSLGAPVDLGASIVTGLLGNPVATLLEQSAMPVHLLRATAGGGMAMYDAEGARISAELDQSVFELWNSMLDRAGYLALQASSSSSSSSLGESTDRSLGRELDKLLRAREALGDLDEDSVRLWHWHRANLEYACATDLDCVSLLHWDQDDPFEYPGDHALLPLGYQALAERLARGIDVRFNTVVQSIDFSDPDRPSVSALCSPPDNDGSAPQPLTLSCDAVLVTLPLALLQQPSILQFHPPLPLSHLSATRALGAGCLNKVVLRFSSCFWDPQADYFGHVSDDPLLRGEFFIFWNLLASSRLPILVSLLAGNAALSSEQQSQADIVSRVLSVLRRIYGAERVPDPQASVVTRWASEPFSRCCYSYIAIGGTGRDHDLLADSHRDPLRADSHHHSRLFFSGEATSREHPATIAGAVCTALRESARIDLALCGDLDPSWSGTTDHLLAVLQSSEPSPKRPRNNLFERSTLSSSSSSFSSSSSSLSSLSSSPLSFKSLSPITSDPRRDSNHHSATSSADLHLSSSSSHSSSPLDRIHPRSIESNPHSSTISTESTKQHTISMGNPVIEFIPHLVESIPQAIESPSEEVIEVIPDPDPDHKAQFKQLVAGLVITRLKQFRQQFRKLREREQFKTAARSVSHRLISKLDWTLFQPYVKVYDRKIKALVFQHLDVHIRHVCSKL